MRTAELPSAAGFGGEYPNGPGGFSIGVDLVDSPVICETIDERFGFISCGRLVALEIRRIGCAKIDIVRGGAGTRLPTQDRIRANVNGLIRRVGSDAAPGAGAVYSVTSRTTRPPSLSETIICEPEIVVDSDLTGTSDFA